MTLAKKDIPSGEELPESLSAKQARLALYDTLSGLTREQISVLRGIPITLVPEYVRRALEDARMKDIHSGIRARLIERLLDDINDLQAWEDELKPIRTLRHEELDGNDQPKWLQQEVDTDRILKTKYKGEKRQLYTLLLALLKAEPEVEDEKNKRKVNDAILEALITVAERKGSLERKLDEQSREEVHIIDVEPIQDTNEEEDA